MIYQYEGKFYDIDTDDHAVARQKIETHLGISPKGALESPAMDAFGEDIKRRGEAALGGLEFGASMASKIPGAIGGGLMGLGNVLAGQGIDKSIESQRYWQEAIDKQFKAFEPQTEFGQLAGEALMEGRERSGDFGGDSPALRTANELAFDIGTMAVPLGPRARVGKTAKQAREATELSRAKEAAFEQLRQRQEQIKLDQAWKDQTLTQGELPLETGFRAGEGPLPYEPTVRPLKDRRGEVQGELFEESPLEYPAEKRTEALRQEREGVPYEEAPPIPHEPQARLEPFREGDMDFPLRQEAWENDRYVQTLKEEFEKWKREGDEAKAQEVLDLAKTYAKEYNITKPNKYKGSMWLDKPKALPIEKTGRPALGESGPRGTGKGPDGKPLPIEKTTNPLLGGPGKRGRRQGGAIDLDGMGFKDLFELAKQWKTKGYKTSWGTPITLGDANRRQLLETLKDIAERNPDLLKQSDILDKGPGRKQRGSIGWKNDPEFLKFKDSLPEPFKKHAKAWWKEQQAKNQPQLPDVVQNQPALDTMDAIPGLKTWKDEIVAPTKSPEELLPQVLNEPDLSTNFFSGLGRQLEAGGKLLGLKTQNTLVRYMAQGIDRVMRESSKAIDNLILDKNTGFKPSWEKLSGEEQAAIWTELMKHEGKLDLDRGALFDLGFNEKQVEAATRLREATKAVHDMLNQGRAAAGKGPVDYRPGYIPSRFRGDYMFEAKDKDGKVIHKVGANTLWGAKRIQKHMQKQMPDLEFSKVKHEPLHRFKDSSDAQAGYQALLEVLADEDPRVAQLESIYADYLTNQGYEALGVKRHFEDKRGVMGGEGEKVWLDAKANAQEGLRSMMNYMDHAIKWSHAQIELKNVHSLMKNKEVQKAQPTTVEWAKAYEDQALGRATKMARAIDSLLDNVFEHTGIGQSLAVQGIRKAKYFGTALYLGFGNAGFSISQIVQTLQTMPAWMATLEAKGAKAAIVGSYARGAMDSMKGMWFGREHMTELGKEAWSYAKDYGIVEPKFLDEVRDWKNTWSNTKAAMDWIATKNMTWFEKVARTQAYMTWVHFLHETGQFKMGRELYETAGQMTDVTMVDYRMHERPMLFKQMGIIGEAANALTTFKHNYFSQAHALHVLNKGVDQRYLKDESGRNVPAKEVPKNLRGQLQGRRGIKGDKDAELIFYTFLMVLGGALSLPIRDDVDVAILLMNQVTPWRTPTSRELLLNTPDSVGFGPMSWITGMDLTSKFSMANAIPDDAVSAAFPFASLYGKMTTTGINAIMNPGKTSAMQFLNSLPPAQRLGAEDYFREGDLMLQQKPPYKGIYRRKPGDDISRKGFAIRSLEESKAMNKDRTLREQEMFYGPKRSRILDKAHAATLERNYMKLGKLVQDFMKYEGDPQEFISRVINNIPERHIDQVTRILIQASKQPQKAPRVIRELKR